MHVVIIGPKGQLGTDLQPALAEYRLTGLAHADLDVTDLDHARALLSELRLDAVVNTSAYHKVKWMRAGFAELRPWHEALGEYLKAKGHVGGRGWGLGRRRGTG